MAATPYEILTFVGRGTSARDYDRLKAALDRLQSTTVMTSIRQPTERRRHRFSWINEWKERADPHGRPLGLELILPDWFYAGVLDEALVLTIDRAYFDLTGGLERWLYRLVRKHGGRQEGGWSFDLKHLHAKSGSLSPLKALRLRPARDRPPRDGCPAIGSSSSAACAAPSASTSRPFLSIRWRLLYAVAASQPHLGISCESSRAIGDRNSRAIGDPILVLSGTKIGRKSCAQHLPRP